MNVLERHEDFGSIKLSDIDGELSTSEWSAHQELEQIAAGKIIHEQVQRASVLKRAQGARQERRIESFHELELT